MLKMGAWVSKYRSRNCRLWGLARKDGARRTCMGCSGTMDGGGGLPVLAPWPITVRIDAPKRRMAKSSAEPIRCAMGFRTESGHLCVAPHVGVQAHENGAFVAQTPFSCRLVEVRRSMRQPRQK
ncbi:hypothetical protein [Cupriavidus pauculus]|uniref:hypothetical protein n=1 Tax=Cupriavidus pauculus TaxID=82633 RepID=UPI0012FD4A25|nr:hypothetical protein [Cupriavidus pauculus]MBY4734161.1 hypothetical protein [Cupriavidus pauculus]